MQSSESIQSIEEALAALGVPGASLHEQEKESLDVQGYVLLRGVLAEDRLAELRQSFDEAATEVRPAESSGSKQTGTRHIGDLLAKGELFRQVCLHPRVLAAVWYVLKRRFVTQQGVHGRDPLPGYGQQGLHTDWMAPGQNGHYDVVTAISLLDDFTAENGATRLVPGSHRLATKINKRVADPAYVHPQQIVIVAPAGTVLVFNGHLLHSATRNRSSSPRRTLQCSFVGHEYARMWGATPPPLDDLSPAARFILGG